MQLHRGSTWTGGEGLRWQTFLNLKLIPTNRLKQRRRQKQRQQNLLQVPSRRWQAKHQWKQCIPRIRVFVLRCLTASFWKKSNKWCLYPELWCQSSALFTPACFASAGAYKDDIVFVASVFSKSSRKGRHGIGTRIQLFQFDLGNICF